MFSLELLEIERIKEEDSRRLQIPTNPEPKTEPKTQEEDEPKRVIVIDL